MDSCGMQDIIPGSKSILQRLMVLLAHSKGKLCVHNYNPCSDVLELERALQIFGFKVEHQDEGVCFIFSESLHRQSPHDYYFEASATAYRLWISVLANLPGIKAQVRASDILLHRGILPLCSALKHLGANCSIIENSLLIEGKSLAGGFVNAQMNLSSQFASSLLLTAPFMARRLSLLLPANPVSMPYLKLSAQMLRLFGAQVDESIDAISAGGGSFSLPEHFTVDSDLSTAAYLALKAALGNEIHELRLIMHPELIQPDMAIWNIMTKMKARIQKKEAVYRVYPSELHGISIDLKDNPDLMPVLSIAALFAHSPSRFSGIGRLVHKESNRLQGICKALDLLGAVYTIDVDAISISPLISDPPACTLDTQEDHRLVMAFSLLESRYPQVKLKERASLAKSVPL